MGRKSPILLLHHAASSDFSVNHEGDIVLFCFLFRQEVRVLVVEHKKLCFNRFLSKCVFFFAVG